MAVVLGGGAMVVLVGVMMGLVRVQGQLVIVKVVASVMV